MADERQCAVCQEPVEPDDRVVLNHDEVIHLECAEHHKLSGRWPQAAPPSAS